MKPLAADLDRDEPFGNMPEEVKPSLARVRSLLDASDESSDKFVLGPIMNASGRYTEVLEERRRNKKRELIAYVASIIGLLVGAVSAVYTFRSPSEADIKRIVEQVRDEKSIVGSIDTAPRAPIPPASSAVHR